MAATLFAMRGRVALIRITKPPVNSLGLAVRKGIWEGIDAAQKEGAAAVVLQEMVPPFRQGCVWLCVLHARFKTRAMPG